VTEKKRLYPIVNADVALFTLQEMALKVLLIQRANNPSPGGWALPGGILDPTCDNSLDDTALRNLATKTKVTLAHLEQVVTHSGPDRDPTKLLLLPEPRPKRSSGVIRSIRDID
jgi:ADP-ribose pyrophosphatase YjhB (NUDIX family)